MPRDSAAPDRPASYLVGTAAAFPLFFRDRTKPINQLPFSPSAKFPKSGSSCESRAILVQGDEGPAQVVRLGHQGTPSVGYSDDGAICPSPAPYHLAAGGRRIRTLRPRPTTLRLSPNPLGRVRVIGR